MSGDISDLKQQSDDQLQKHVDKQVWVFTEWDLVLFCVFLFFFFFVVLQLF